MSRAKMDALGWDSCDVILVTGDAIDHPSFGMAWSGGCSEAQSFPGRHHQPAGLAFRRRLPAGWKPNLFYGVTAGNMDSMTTLHLRPQNPFRRRLHPQRPNPTNAPTGPSWSMPSVPQRPPRANVVIGSIRGEPAPHRPLRSLVRRRCAVPVRRRFRPTVILPATPSGLWWRSPAGWPGEPSDHPRPAGYAFMVPPAGCREKWTALDSTSVDTGPGGPYRPLRHGARPQPGGAQSPSPATAHRQPRRTPPPPARSSGPGRSSACRRLRQVKDDQGALARLPHLPSQSNPGNPLPWSRPTAGATIWLNRRPFPHRELDQVLRAPPAAASEPAARPDSRLGMIRFSINIMRGCFSGCTFCSITEHEGRIIQSRSEESVLRKSKCATRSRASRHCL